MTFPTSETFVFNEILAGSNQEPISDDDAVLISGQNLVKGSVLGVISVTFGTPVYDGGNTGNGTVTAYTLGAGAQQGNYVLTCGTAAANGGVFQVMAPDGYALPDATVGTAYVNQINFTINDGSTDWVVGDKITLPINAGSGKYTLSLAAAVDGSQNPAAILADDTDASGGDQNAPVYIAGEFNEDLLTYGTGHTAASVKAALHAVNIYLKTPVSA